MKRQRLLPNLLCSIGIMALTGTAAYAIPVLDFGMIPPTSGSISYPVGGGPLIGTNLQVDNVTGVGTPLLDGVSRTFNPSLNGPGSPPVTFTSTSVVGGDILNSPTAEPGTIMLLGSGLIGFGYLARRRQRT